MLGVPSAKRLFHRAIGESGPLTRFATPEQADEVGRAMLRHLGISAHNPAALHDVPMQQVLDAEAAGMSSVPMSFAAAGFLTGF